MAISPYKLLPHVTASCLGHDTTPSRCLRSWVWLRQTSGEHSLDPRPFPPPAINIRVTFEPCAELRRDGRFSSRDAWHGRHHYALRLTRAIVNVMLLTSECERLCTSVGTKAWKGNVQGFLYISRSDSISETIEQHPLHFGEFHCSPIRPILRS